MNKKVEFHCHTTASDGNLSPINVIERAKKKNISIIAITDHDTTLGLSEGLSAGEELDIKVIPGIELSTIHNDESIHILGFFKDESYKNKKLQVFLKSIEDSRVSRGEKIVKNLKKYFDIDIDYEKVREKSNGVIARPHIASTIVDAGYPYEWEHIFKKFLSNDSPAYVHNKKVSIEEGIKILKEHNAIVILAHPKLVKKTPLEELIKYGFDGIEAVYYQNFKRETEQLTSLARRNNLLITCGSDFHGIIESDTKHGDIGDMSNYLQPEDLEKFLNALYK